MAAPVIAVERFRVEHGEGFSMPVVSLTDRRAAGNRLVRFVFQRQISRRCPTGARKGVLPKLVCAARREQGAASSPSIT